MCAIFSSRILFLYLKMSLKKKRNRSINWDEEEKQLFRSVLKEFATSIENKSLDNNTNKLKTKAWEELQKKFNELNGRLRSLNELKIQWKTMKINARKEVSLFKRTTNKTGGGGRSQTPTNDVIKINDLLNPAELLRDENMYDSDGIICILKFIFSHGAMHVVFSFNNE